MTGSKKKASAPALESAAEATPNHQSIGATVSHDNQRQQTAASNLQQAAAIEKSSNWTIARLIAASVEGARGKRTDVAPRGAKLAIKEAARVMGRSDNTIRAYLDAWNAAAADGHCSPSTDLTPDDGWTAELPADHLWEQYRNPNSHSTKKPDTTTLPADPVLAAKEASGRMTSEQKSDFIAEAITSDPETQRAAMAALDQVFEEDRPKPYPMPSAGGKDAVDSALDLIIEFRKLHKGVDHIVQLVNDGSATIVNRDAVLREISWLRTALGYIEDGVKSDNLAAEIAEFLQEVGE